MSEATRILLWDSQPHDRARIMAALGLYLDPFHLIRVSTAEQFRAALTDSPHVALVRYDVPDRDAPATLAWSRQACPSVPVIFVAEKADASEVVTLWHEGAADFLLLDQLSRLPAAVRRAIDQSQRSAEAEKALELNHRYREAIRATGQILFEWDQITDDVTFAGDVEGITGLQPEELNGNLKRYFELVHPDDRKSFLERLEQARSKAHSCHQVYRLIRPDGMIRHVESRGFLLREQGVVNPKRIGFITDISQRIKAEEDLRESRRLLQTVLDNIPIGVFWKDRNSRYLGCNRRVADAFGFQGPHEMIGKCDLEFPCLKREEAEFFLQKDREVMERNEGEIGIVEPATFADGRHVWLETSKVPMHDHEGRVVGVLGIWQDITEKRQLEERLRQTLKMEAIGRLAGGVAHDFNNLLTVINGYTDLLLGQMEPGDARYDSLTQIRKAGLRASGLTRQLLAFSRKTVLVPAVIDLNELLLDMEKLLYPLLGENVVLQIKTSNPLWRVKVDPTEMSQVVINLCVNARDAMPQGGVLRVETANVDLDEAHAAVVEGARPGPHVCLTVADTGTGMDDATKARIFEPFFTTKGPEKGTGLGLATVYGIVRQSGGHIEVESEVGKGTTFRVYLPRVCEERRKAKSHLLPQRPTPKGRETVLLVEDEDGVRKLARLVLEGSGYCVLEAANGPDALRLCSESPCPIDLLVTDVVMPMMSGPQLAREVLAARPGLRVLYLSGYTDDEIIRHGISEGESAFLHKPFTPAHLARKVREVLDS